MYTFLNILVDIHMSSRFSLLSLSLFAKTFVYMCMCFNCDSLCEFDNFFLGCSDQVACFYCGVELRKWGPKDDAWKTHAKVSPQCQHVLNEKGQAFVDQSADTEVCLFCSN
jgi:hypothetical protein